MGRAKPPDLRERLHDEASDCVGPSFPSRKPGSLAKERARLIMKTVPWWAGKARVWGNPAGVHLPPAHTWKAVSWAALREPAWPSWREEVPLWGHLHRHRESAACLP